MVRQFPGYAFEFDDRPAVSDGIGIDIRWQHGPIVNETLNGATVEGVLTACGQRLAELDNRLPSQHNKDAIQHITAAIAALHERTRDRYHRGVMGTNQS